MMQDFDSESQNEAQNQPETPELPLAAVDEPIHSEGEAVSENLVALNQRRRTRIKMPSFSDLVVYGLLILIMAMGAYFRFVGQNWDDHTHLHPDERFLTGVVLSINPSTAGDPLSGRQDDTPAEQTNAICRQRYPLTNGAGDYFDSLCSTWYPRNTNNGLYVYGEFPLYVVRIAAEWTQQVYNFATQSKIPGFDGTYNALGYETVHFIGRTVSATADVLTIFFVFLIGRRLFGKWTGLVAALLYASAVFPIQLSHYWTTDAFTNLPVVISFWFAVRVMDRGKWYDFMGFGIAFGAAVASRVNVLPLFGVVGLAAIIYGLPVLDRSLVYRERMRLFWRMFLGLTIAAIFSFGAFRILNPHAFAGGQGALGFFQVINQYTIAKKLADPGYRPDSPLEYIFYKPWLANIGTAQTLTNGSEDFPPAYQWSGRTAYLFPLGNIVLWGLGAPLGITAWIAWLIAGIMILRNRPGWTRLVLPVVWILVYFAIMGRNWVSTMRYFMPIYPFLILLAAWAMVIIVQYAWQKVRENPTLVRRSIQVAGVVLLIGVLLGTVLYANGFTSIYKRELTRVEASRWAMRNIPSAFSTTLTTSDGNTRLINWSMFGNVTGTSPNKRYTAGNHVIIPFIPTISTSIDRVIINHLQQVPGTASSQVFHVDVSADPNGNLAMAQGQTQIDFSQSPDQNGIQITYTPPIPVVQGQQYFLVTYADDGLTAIRNESGAGDFLVANALNPSIAIVRLPDQPIFQPINGGVSFNDSPVQGQFTVPLDGTIKEINVTHLLSLGSVTVNVKLTDTTTNQPIGGGKLSVNASSTKTSLHGDTYTIPLDAPVTLPVNHTVSFQVSTDGSPVQAVGTVIADEGDWDDSVPYKVCPLPNNMELTHDTPSGLTGNGNCDGIDMLNGGWYHEAKASMSGEDDPSKRDGLLAVLNEGDYYTISSNRFYDSEAQMPIRFPMSIKFYDALFKGQAGFTLIKTVTSYADVGGIAIADQNLPIFNTPAWMHQFQSEEAFSVYDHPAVFIFKKNADYNAKALSDLLTSVVLATPDDAQPDPTTALVGRIKWPSFQAGQAPTGFMMKPQQAAIQQQGGTWSQLFDRLRLINTSDAFATIIWWLTIMFLGWITWPLLFVLIPGLPDRGYPIAKLGGMLIVAWIAWVGGTANLLTWSAPGLAIIMALLAVFSLYMAFRHRRELTEYIRLNWRHLVIVELITLALFLAFVFVRLGNPDLWAQSLGGEKPMDFSYLNGVLRSTVFPPYDPWYSGGYLNYYYFGFVLVGMPVKLLGMMPSVAYNLIVPTLFALTGIGAFSVAFNIVASRWFFPTENADVTADSSAKARRRFALRLPPASPYVAGILAMLMCVVIGNLDTPRTILGAAASSGGYNAAQCMQSNGQPPTPMPDGSMPSPTLGQSICDTTSYIASVISGIGSLVHSGQLPVGTDRWFWAARSVVGELPNPSNEINEMPSFTFIFGDLHAHMIAMPLTLLAILWLLGEVLGAGFTTRTWFTFGLSALFGGLVVGVLFATNTWDWLTYTVLTLPGLAFAAYLGREPLGRRKLLMWLGQTALFLVAWYAAAIPFKAYFASSFNSAQLFTGSKTPIWAYLDIHGLFIFIIATLLVWQTVRLLRSVFVKDFIGQAWLLPALAGVVSLTILIALVMFIVPIRTSLFGGFALPVPISILCLPMIIWCGLLFLVPDQTREMRILLTLAALGLGVSYAVEFVVLGGDIGRQNTFFKFYIQAWILFSVVSGVALAYLLQASARWSLTFRIPWLSLVVLMLAVCALYPIMAVQGKIGMRMAPDAPHVLDGDAYLANAQYVETTWDNKTVTYSLNGDLTMIHWMEDNVTGSPVIIEAEQPEYTHFGNRVSINTGLPGIVGWRFHQTQQRTIDPLPRMVDTRKDNIQSFYNTADIGIAWKMIQFYNIQYIVVGTLEKTIYVPQGIAKFDSMVSQKLIKLVYDDHNGNQVYQVIPGASYNSVLGAFLR